MKAVIMAGGKGTRLQSIATDIPKPMFTVNGKPILEYQIESLKNSKIQDITIVVGHKKEVIKEYFTDGRRLGVHIDYIEETEPLGTAGALFFLKELKDDFLLLFGDLILDVDFNKFMSFHKNSGAGITLFVHPNTHPYDSDVVVVNENNRVTEILSKKAERSFYYHNLVNAGIYCINPRILEMFDEPRKIDLEKDIISRFIKSERVFAYRSTEYVKDMGTPDRLKLVENDIQNGVVSGRNLKNRQRAIFLDRDGTINKYVGFLRNPEDLI